MIQRVSGSVVRLRTGKWRAKVSVDSQGYIMQDFDRRGDAWDFLSAYMQRAIDND